MYIQEVLALFIISGFVVMVGVAVALVWVALSILFNAIEYYLKRINKLRMLIKLLPEFEEWRSNRKE